MALLASGNNLMFIATPIYKSLGIRQSNSMQTTGFLIETINKAML